MRACRTGRDLLLLSGAWADIAIDRKGEKQSDGIQQTGFFRNSRSAGGDQVARTRALTRKYNQIEHSDSEARAAM